ncbi:solute carrier family 28 member 3 [Orussus abietinus]|uniref:solute carrier family 28 member 3 n=1 Tax=Orussus abietinus TaxID=222816 RepID=UPI00062538B0|nr:solute carrier family 28 member 3 [Orussus abietinus]XP_012270179.1 solute carrier family 28 member 3 [Orussus abietinus]XP_012270180.1 solute carrier family 28 member 3 [Orussus abietinus]
METMSGAVNYGFAEDPDVEMMEKGTRKELNHEKASQLSESTNCLARFKDGLEVLFSRNPRFFAILGWAILNSLVFAYLILASLHWTRNTKDCAFEWCDGFGMLLIVLGITYFGLLYYKVFKRYLGKPVTRCCRPIFLFLRRNWETKFIFCTWKTITQFLILLGIVIFLVFDTVGSRDRLISFTGLIVLLTLGWIFSKHPGHINWRPVIWGLILQFCFGLFTIRWNVGRAIFQCVSEKIATFLDFATNGATFVFSNFLVHEKAVFAFSVLPVIFFFSLIIQVLYYLGAMQWVIMKLGWILQGVLGTTICESLVAAGNIFLGMTESPLLIKPYLPNLTSSEIHAVMCSGFASVSGTVLAAYIGFGAQPAHLITASVMSAPASLCYSKLFYPETEKSLTTFKNIPLQKSDDSGVLDAATKGALAGIPIVLGIIANIIAFVSVIAFMNSILSWLGVLVGVDGLTFEFILSKVFMPLSWIMGVQWDQCEDVATLIGLKTVVNEFVAYQKLGEFKEAGKLSPRTEAIATYAICGFSNPGSLGIMIALLVTLAPEKKEQITRVIVRAFFAGSAVCFLTASIAGMLMNEDFFTDTMVARNSTNDTTMFHSN